MSTQQSQQPYTLEQALERIHVLERQLRFAAHLVGNRFGFNLEQAIAEEDNRANSDMHTQPLAAQDPPASLSSSSTPPPSPADDGDDAAPPAPAAIDIGPFVLKALALRKSLATGQVEEADGEAELDQIVAGSGLSDEQVKQVREWAGLG
ncbi:hypothetical protein JCM21900_000051 [Sporobolomyces salmonicolor]